MRVLPLISLAVILLVRVQPAHSDEVRRRLQGPKITFSRETTYISEPRTETGFLDFSAAIDDAFKRGVTPENNAAVLLFDALGPAPNGDRLPDAFFERLGRPVPAEAGRYFIDLRAFLIAHAGYDETDARHAEVFKQRDVAVLAPWDRAEYPHLESWLQANKKPLGRVAEAVLRPRYFTPFVLHEDASGRQRGILAVRLSTVIALREVARALGVRAMLHLAESRYEAAWRDLQTLHRLGRLVAQASIAMECLVGYHLDRAAFALDVAFVEHARPNHEAVRRLLGDLDRLPPLPEVVDRVDLTERLASVDTVLLIAEGDPESEQLLMRSFDEYLITLQREVHDNEFPEVEWDAALRVLMRWHDRLSAALHKPDPLERYAACHRFDLELQSLEGQFRHFQRFRRALQPPADRKRVGEVIGELLATRLLRSCVPMQQAEDRTRQWELCFRLPFLLSAFRNEHGHYPERLDDLIPTYLNSVPLEVLNGGPLVYRRTADGYEIRSLGFNGRDDQQRGPDDEPAGDDIIIRIPRPEDGA